MPHSGTKSRLLKTIRCSHALASTIRLPGLLGSQPRSNLHFCNVPFKSIQATINCYYKTKVKGSPSKFLLILVRGRRESLISSTTSVFVSNAGSIPVNFIMCPGNQDGGAGRLGIGICVRTILRAVILNWMVPYVFPQDLTGILEGSICGLLRPQSRQ